MAFWDDWELPFDMDANIVGISLGMWAICGLVLFKGPTLMGSMEAVKLFGIPWNIMSIIIFVLALPLSLLMTQLLINRNG